MSTCTVKFTAFIGLMLLSSTVLGQSETRIQDPFANVPNAFTNEYLQKMEIERAPVLAQQVAKPPTTPKLAPASQQNQHIIMDANAGRIVMGGNTTVGGDAQWVNHVVGANNPKLGETAGHHPLGTAGHFMFSSARHKRAYLGGSDFDSIPDDGCACDEWQNFCECDNCRTNWGANFWRPRWTSHWFKHGSKCWNGHCK